jgi:hypothetical protein
MTIFIASVAFIGLAMLVMSIGVIFSNKCLRGSCGGPDAIGPDGQPMSCPTCTNKHNKEKTVEEPIS